MEISERVENGVNIMTVTGTIDSLTSNAMLSAFLSSIDAGAASLVADLRRVEYTSSAGLRALLAAQKAIRKNGGDLRLAGVQPNVRKVLEMTGFNTILKIYDEVEAAIASFDRA